MKPTHYKVPVKKSPEETKQEVHDTLPCPAPTDEETMLLELPEIEVDVDLSGLELGSAYSDEGLAEIANIIEQEWPGFLSARDNRTNEKKEP